MSTFRRVEFSVSTFWRVEFLVSTFQRVEFIVSTFCRVQRIGVQFQQLRSFRKFRDFGVELFGVQLSACTVVQCALFV